MAVGETGVSWAGYCLRSHNSGVIEDFIVRLLSLDSPFLTILPYFDRSILSILVLPSIQASCLMSQLAPLRGKLGEFSGQVGTARKIQVQFFTFLAFSPGFGTPFWPPLTFALVGGGHFD